MILPAVEHRRLTRMTPAKLTQGADKFAHRLVGIKQRRRTASHSWRQQAETIHETAESLHKLTDKQLKVQLYLVAQEIRRQPARADRVIDDALALLAAVATRTLGLNPHPVQLFGALLLYHGQLAEMATGEGKTLTAALTACLFAWTGRPCHLITANDYLANRDTGHLTDFYRFSNLTTAAITANLAPEDRRNRYRKSVVYTTSKEILADYLRDQLALGDVVQADRRLLLKPLSEQYRDIRVMNGIYAAIIDEADSVLIDEAVTPLLISQPRENIDLKAAVSTAWPLSRRLQAGTDYVIEESFKQVVLTRAGNRKLDEISAALPGLWQNVDRREELILTALSAREFFHNGKQYVVEDDRVIIVDEFTGRMMPQRSWQHGLQQFIELAEAVPLSDPNETLARLSFQRFFRFFPKLCGLTGTAVEAADEFWQVYQLAVHEVPHHLPCRRQQRVTKYFRTNQEKLAAICEEVRQCQKSGQPVLIGSRTVSNSQLLAEMLSGSGIQVKLLNAVKHREEAEIISMAGQRGVVTIATNMAGRGADIKLGKGVAELGGLHVIVSERNESGRIDRQLIGRCARQGEPGSYRIYCSLEDEILSRFGNRALLSLLGKTGIKEDGANLLLEKAFLGAQMKAQKKAYRQREKVTGADELLADALTFRQDPLNE